MLGGRGAGGLDSLVLWFLYLLLPLVSPLLFSCARYPVLDTHLVPAWDPRFLLSMLKIALSLLSNNNNIRTEMGIYIPLFNLGTFLPCLITCNDSIAWNSKLYPYIIWEHFCRAWLHKMIVLHGIGSLYTLFTCYNTALPVRCFYLWIYIFSQNWALTIILCKSVSLYP